MLRKNSNLKNLCKLKEREKERNNINIVAGGGFFSVWNVQLAVIERELMVFMQINLF